MTHSCRHSQNSLCPHIFSLLVDVHCLLLTPSFTVYASLSSPGWTLTPCMLPWCIAKEAKVALGVSLLHSCTILRYVTGMHMHSAGHYLHVCCFILTCIVVQCGCCFRPVCHEAFLWQQTGRSHPTLSEEVCSLLCWPSLREDWPQVSVSHAPCMDWSSCINIIILVPYLAHFPHFPLSLSLMHTVLLYFNMC